MDRCAVAASLLACLLYMNTLTADFAYDDSRAILKNQDLLPETAITSIFYNDFWGTPLTHSGSHKSYRPLCVLTFRLNYYLHGLNAMGFHLGNVILHSIVTGLFTYVAKILMRRTFASFVAGLLFAVHPIHTEAVAGIVGRADIGACLFFLLTLLNYINYCNYRDRYILNKSTVKTTEKDNSYFRERHKKWLYMLLVAVFTGAGMVTKEQGVTVIAVCAVYDVFIHRKISPKQFHHIFTKNENRGTVEGMLCLTVIGLVLIAVRVMFMGLHPPEFAPADNPASDSASVLTRTLTYWYLPVLNFWLLLCPYVLSFDWSMEAVPLLETLTDLRNLWTLAFYSLLGYFAFYVIQTFPNAHDACVATKTLYVNGNGCSNVHSNSQPTNNLTSHKERQYSLLKRRRRGSSSSTESVDDSTPQTSTNFQHLRVLILSLSLMVFPFIPATNLFFYVGFVIAERVLYIPSMGFCLLVAEGAHILYVRHKSDPRQKRLIVAAVTILLTMFSIRTVCRNRDWANEENLYHSGIAVNPAKAWGNLANIYNSQGRVEEAESAYKAALSYRSNMADVHYNLGILLQERKRYQEAVESYKRAIHCRPRLTMAHLNLGIVYGILGKLEEAEDVYRHCSTIDTTGLKDPRLHESTKISALYNLARLLTDKNRNEDAIEIYQDAIKRRPSHYQPQSLYNMLGEAYMKLNRFEEARHWYKEALTSKPDHVPAHLTMGKLMQKMGKTAEAKAWFDKALILSPNDSSVFQHYAQYLGETGKLQQAAIYYLKAAKLTPDDFELVCNTANALRQIGRNKEAEEHYRRAVRLKPEVATAHMNLGAMLHLNQKYTEAEQSYIAALKLKPDDTMTQTNLRKLRNLSRSFGKK
ncbi:protein O-mannosyl-transferase TMTC2-like [Tubulanus polymorphus]|uniref:protein O-mannosyl-transferase TMTC2-like n=1 Tax=Tubulanus polymorphus TaxID=672921 RepID=UPI003DA5C32A